MGFVNKESGSFNEKLWNWNTDTDTSATAKKRAFHVVTKGEQTKKALGLTTQDTRIGFSSPELKAGNQSTIRRATIRSKPKTEQLTKTTHYRDLKFSEANMVMYLNTLDLNLLNSNSEEVSYVLDKTFVTDSDLEKDYNEKVDNYNKKEFDPEPQTLTDGNGVTLSHKISFIKETKSSPVMPTLDQYKEQYRLSGRKAQYSSMLQKKGMGV